jgi:ABC-type cobalamin transport system ATPase subunit
MCLTIVQYGASLLARTSSLGIAIDQGDIKRQLTPSCMLQTTPECNEGLRWHLFDEPMTITAADQKQLMDNQAHSFIRSGANNIELLFKTNTQYIQAQNDRVVYRMGAPLLLCAGTGLLAGLVLGLPA